MSLLDIFKKKPTQWEVFRNFLIKDCFIPFNRLHTIETAIESIINTISADKGAAQVFAINGVTDDDRFILQMGIAAKLSDEKYSTAILFNENSKNELIDALGQWQTKDCKINIGEIPTCKSKKGRAYIDLFDKLESGQIAKGIIYIYDAAYINQNISVKVINI